MKKVIIVLALFIPIVLNSCNGDELKRLQSQNDSLRSVATTGGVKIDEYFAAFNSIQENLNSIKEKEQIISVKTGNGQELDQTSSEQINEDILSIYDLLLQNKQTIKDLNKKLQRAGLKNTEMNKTVKLLTEQITAKDKEIEDLKTKLAQLNFDVEQLNQQVAELSTTIEQEHAESEAKTEVINQQDTYINTVYYVYGTKKELISHQVVTNEGLFKGLKIGDNFDKNYFTKIDLREVTSIKLNVKSLRILSAHPENSYKLIQNDNTIESIEITDPEKFWERSKFLVMLTN